MGYFSPFTDGTDQDTGYEDLRSVISKQPNLFAAIMSRRKVGIWLLCTGGRRCLGFCPSVPDMAHTIIITMLMM